MASPNHGPAPTRLRQIALVAKDLKRAEHLLTTVLGTEVIFVDPGVEKWGLRNILVAVGGDVIEVVSPYKPNTTAGRLLDKRGDGGYMIIMQTVDAPARRAYIESRGLAKVIFSHGDDESVCIQYHPKGIKGGVMPELDSHAITPTNPSPLTSRFSPWHACGKDYASYAAGMRRCAHLRLRKAVCRLAPGDADTDAALRQWEGVFGVPREGDGLAFTNASVGFKGCGGGGDGGGGGGGGGGVDAGKEGLASLTIAVEGKDGVRGVVGRASKLGLPCDELEGWVDMLGVRWYFVADGDAGKGVASKI